MNFNGSVPGMSYTVPPTTTGRFLADDGKVSTPSYTFESDTKLGIYKSGDKTMTLVSDGAPVMDISDDGVSVYKSISAELQPYIKRRVFPAQTAPDGSETILNYNEDQGAKGDGITWSADEKLFVLSLPGTYNIQGYHYFEANSFSGRRTAALYFAKGGGSLDTECISDGRAVADGIWRVAFGANVSLDTDETPGYVQVTALVVNDGGLSDPCDVISTCSINKTS